METSRYIKLFLARKWVILIVTLVTMGVLVFLNLRSDPTYTATAKLRVVPFGTNAPDYGTFIYFDRLASTYSEILASEVVTEEARFRLGLEVLPEYGIETIPQTELMRLSVTAEDPLLAQSVANTLATILVEQNELLAARSLGEIRDYLQTEMQRIQGELDLLLSEQAILAARIPRDSVRLAELSAQVASREQQYDLLLSNYSQAVVSQSNQANAVTIFQNATVPSGPSSTSTTRTAIMGGAIGLIAGLAFAFVLELVNPRLYTERQIEEIARAGIKGRIPYIRRRYTGNVFLGDVFAIEAFRRLGANLMSGSDHAWRHRMILVTSSIPGEGKSTLSANLALALARAQRSVVLVDCDMRRPTQHAIFGVTPNGSTLYNILTERAPIEETLEDVGVENLSLIPAGFAASVSTELLSTQRMTMLTAHLLEHFDFVILDGPAVLAASDSLVLAKASDRLLLVVDQQRVSQRTLDLACAQLESIDAPETSVVLNRVKRDSALHSRGYYPRQTVRKNLLP